MMFVKTLKREIAKLIKSGQLSEEELCIIHKEVLEVCRESNKMHRYVIIGVDALVIISYVYAMLYEGYILDIFEFVGIFVFATIFMYFFLKIETAPIKWQFRRAVKMGYPHLAKQFNLSEKSIKK